MNDLAPHLALQIRVSRTLSIGFVLTVWPLSWATSGVAIIIGVWAMSIIKQSQDPLAGKILAWWCIIVGSLESLVSLSFVIHASLE
jgi:hypothetical protein